MQHLIKKLLNKVRDNLGVLSLGLLHFALVKFFDIPIIKGIWLGVILLCIFTIVVFLKYE